MIARVENKVFKQDENLYYAFIRTVEGYIIWECSHNHDNEAGAELCGHFEMNCMLSPEDEEDSYEEELF